MSLWIEAVGFAGGVCTVVAYWMKDMLPLRIAVVTSSVFLLAYAALIGSWPVLLMELVVLPINGLRLCEALRAAVQRQDSGSLSRRN
jgi:hypothetical protein